MDTRISSRTSAVVAIIAAVLAMLWAPASAAPPDGITEYPLSSGLSPLKVPSGIAAGLDGNLWFTESQGNAIGRITPAGTITEYPLPTAGSQPNGIAAGPDGNLWFTEFGGHRIGRITPAGTITEYPLPTADGLPNEIAAGPDGNLWFTQSRPNQIGRLTAAGTITEYPLPTYEIDIFLGKIAAGPDGNLWFTEIGHTTTPKIGRITPTGTITEYPLPTVDSGPHGIAAGPDGNMWFTSGSAIWRITPTGVVTEFPPTGYRSSGGGDIAAGPDGNMWFTAGTAIGRITPTGDVTKYLLPGRSVPGGRGDPYAIAAGPDGNLWFTERAGNKIGRITPTATPTPIVKKTCPIRVTLHKPTPKRVGSRILTDKITTKTPTCVLPKPVVRCRPLASTAAGKKALCDTKVTKRGMIRVDTKGYQAVRATVILRAKPTWYATLYGWWTRWKPDTWRKAWLLR